MPQQISAFWIQHDTISALIMIIRFLSSYGIFTISALIMIKFLQLISTRPTFCIQSLKIITSHDVSVHHCLPGSQRVCWYVRLQKMFGLRWCCSDCACAFEFVTRVDVRAILKTILLIVDFVDSICFVKLFFLTFQYFFLLDFEWCGVKASF